MPGVGGELYRRHHLVADDVDRVEVVREADEVLVVAQVPVAPAAHPVVHAGRPRDETECHVVAAEDQALVRVAPGNRERRWGEREQLGHEAAVHPHCAARFVHVRPHRPEHLPGTGAHELDAELLQNPHRGGVDGLDLVVGQDLERRVGVPRLAPRELGNAAFGALAALVRRASAAPASPWLFLLHARLALFGAGCGTTLERARIGVGSLCPYAGGFPQSAVFRGFPLPRERREWTTRARRGPPSSSLDDEVILHHGWLPRVARS